MSSLANPTPAYQRYVGVDIARKDFTAAQLIPGGKPKLAGKPFGQDQAGFARFIEWLSESGLTPSAHLIVMEATGPYWVALAVALYSAGFAVSVVNPAQAHYFAKAQLKRAKSDALDAQTLAEFAQALLPATWTPPPQAYHELKQRLSQRDNLIKMRVQVENQLHALSVNPVIIKSVQSQLETLSTTLREQIATMEEEIEIACAADKTWQKTIDLLQTIPGIGPLTACWLVVASLNFTLCPSVQALVNFVGLAPVTRTSGSSIRGRPQISRAGHATLRRLLYLGTLTAARFNPLIKPFWQRLREEKHKPAKVARCACARKMLHIAFAVVKSGKSFDPAYGLQEPVEAALASA